MSGRRVVVLVVVLALVVGAAGVAVALLTGRAGEPDASSTPEPPPPVLYLALGDSLAAGYQPANPGDRTDPDGGYAGGVLAGLAAAAEPGQQAPELVNLGCPGETSASFAAGGRCDYAEGSQLDAALTALAGAGERPVVVSLDLGANDVVGCIVPDVLAPRLDEECVDDGLSTVERELPQSLRQLRDAAPDARFVVLDYYNPFLAVWLVGAGGQELAQQSAPVLERLNGAVAGAAEGVDADLAQVSEAFSSQDFSVPEGSSTPVNVERVCEWTWMCDRFDIHANDEGYAVLAEQALRALGEEPTDDAG